MKTKNDVKTILSNQIYLRDSKDSKTRFFRFHHTNFLFFLSFNKLHYVLEGEGGVHTIKYEINFIIKHSKNVF